MTDLKMASEYVLLHRSKNLLAWVKHVMALMRALENHFQDVMKVLSVDPMDPMDLCQYQEQGAFVN